MRTHNIKAILNSAARVIGLLLFGAVVAFGQQTVNLTAGPTTLTLPDGSVVPMWGYSCNAVQVAGSTATCGASNPAALLTMPASWSPVVITVPTGQDLTINLTNSLPTPPGAAAGIPTSLVIVGQLGGGLGTPGGFTAAPDHTNAQGTATWPIAGAPGVAAPAQGPRVQSFGTEVPAGTTAALCWGVTCTPSTPALKPGTYLIESGTHPSIQGPMGLYGILVVTTAPASAGAAGTAYPISGTSTTGAPVPVTYNSELPLVFSEIDPVQNAAVAKAVTLSGFSETTVWSGLPGGCGNQATANSGNCYPPAVNYTPLYYMINGVAFDKTHASTSLFQALPASATGTVLVRMVNAGLRMHVPSIVGSQTTGQTGAATPTVTGFQLIAEDGNVLPGVPRVQSEVFMPAGKTNDVMFNAPAAGASALPVFDRELSLSGNATARDAGMLAYIGVNGAGLPALSTATGGIFAPATVQGITYNSVLSCTTAPCTPLVVSDPSKGVISVDTNVYGVHLYGATPGVTTGGGSISLNANGTFTYTPYAGFSSASSDTFTYCANGSNTATNTCSSNLTATVTLGSASMESAGGITMANIAYSSNVTTLAVKPPGILSVDSDGRGYPLTVVTSGPNAPGAITSGLTLTMDSNGDGGFTASIPSCSPVAPATTCPYTFNYHAQNSQGTVSASTATVTINFAVPSNLVVSVLDGQDKTTQITDYRWVIEEDRTFHVDPANTATTGTATTGTTKDCTTNPAACTVPLTFGTNFHTSYMPLIAAGCTSTFSCEGGQTLLGVPAVCDVGNGVCRTTATQEAVVNPSQVHLDPTKRYYISVLPGDAANSFVNGGGAPITDDNGNPVRAFDMKKDCDYTIGTGTCGHGMGGAPVIPTCTTTGTTTTCAFNPVTVLVQPNPFPPSKLSVFVFEDDFPLNGEHDAGGGTGAVNTNNEAGLGQFNVILFDDAGGTGDATGQMTYDMFNQPLVNSLAGTIDPTTGKDACPISTGSRTGQVVSAPNSTTFINDATQTGITGTIVTCPQFELDGTTPSPLAGQAVVANLMPGRYGVVATPGADRIARGEEWLQTNTLDGQKAHDSFLRIGEPSFFQEYGPAGYHVSIGFANPAIINSRHAGICAGTDPNFPAGAIPCNNTVTGKVTTTRMSRTPDQRLYGSGDNSSFAFTQCYVSFGDADGEDFAFTKCNPADGTFSISGLPDGDWRVTVFDQWNDMLVDGLSTPVRLSAGTTAKTTPLGDIATNQWQTNIYTTTFFDQNGNGVPDQGEPGLTLVSTNIRFRDGSYSNFNNTDLAGNAGFNEIFPLFSWYVIETDSTRYKSTGTHVVYDAGGPADGNCGAGTVPCGTSSTYVNMANTAEQVPLPTNLRVPGARYCASADCPTNDTAGGSTGRVDPPWVVSEGWQGFSGENEFVDFGKAPFAPGENGGIHGEVIYASTRPFDDPSLLIHTSWTPDVPGVTINLYQESTDSGPGTGNTGATTLKLVDTTTTSSWDDWAQGFRSDGIPNMNCPGQMRNPTTTAGGAAGDLFFFTLYNQPNYLDVYNSLHGGPAVTPLPNNSQFKCYDGMHNWNQVQPAPYDGYYTFPSVTGRDPHTGNTTGTNCTICVKNNDPADAFRFGKEDMLPAGKYVVEMVVPPGYELVKEEDKNILIGDNYIAPVTQEFGGLGNIFILPDQAAVGATFNANNAQNPTQDLGRPRLPQGEGDTGSVEQFWPCVGAMRIVPDYISLFPQSKEVSPFAGANRPLCDRKEVTLTDAESSLAKFWVFTSAHVAAHFTGVITDDYTSEFDPFSPQFGEKFSPANLPISIKDWSGTEIARTYADQWGSYDGITYSTWEVNPPNPTGYAPTMMVTCMNDPGTGPTPDPLFNPEYSQFCYEIPFMPGQTQYMDTPVVPTTAFAGAGYNNVDCSYPDATPAIAEVDSQDGLGPWVSAAGHTLTITALGDQMVPNYAYSGPSATTAPFNQKTVKRHYGFGTTRTPGAGLAAGGVTIGGVPVTSYGTWNDTTITVTVPSGVPPCPVQQQPQYGGPSSTGSPALCGELVITTAAANVGGHVTGVSVTPPPATNRGGTYTGNPPVAPTVTFSGGGGTGAAATANLGPATGSIASVSVTNGGSGYNANFTVTFSGGGGTGAHGTAVVRRRVTAVTVSNPTTNCYPGTGTIGVTFTGAGGGGTTAAGTAITAASGTCARRVTGVNITNPGSYALTGTITVTFSVPSGTGASRATGSTTTTGFVSSVTMTGGGNSGGSGYSTTPTPPTPVFTAGSGTGATGTATLSTTKTATVVSVTVTNPGSGYTSAPTVTFSGPASTRAIGTATIDGPATVVSGKQSIDTVTVTIGGKPPHHVTATQSIQAEIDAAAPGDLIIVDPAFTPASTAPAGTSCASAAAPTATCVESVAAHSELLIMWKPVRLQGVGAATSIINANTHPAGELKLDAWRRQIDCLFGLGMNGAPISSAKTAANAGANAFDPTGTFTCGSTNGVAWNYFNGYDESAAGAGAFNPQVDRLPLEATLGWDANLNGNLAELLQEPSLMGALEGAGITVLSKGVAFPSDPYDASLLAGFPTGTTLLQDTLAAPTGGHCADNPNPYPSNFWCNPSSIDGLGITDSSQGGGGVFVHGWGHNLQIANNRIYNNAGTLSGGINLGQGEFGPSYIQGSITNAAPGSCEESPVPNAVLPYCENVNVNIHNNSVTLNSSTGDELFSATPAGAGGVSICTGSDYYKFNYNWICGNLTNGDGGGVGHLGFSYNGDIEHNTIIFNQSSNPTIPANGGGLIVMGTPDADLVCNLPNNPNGIDQDCVPFGAPGGNSGNTPLSGVGPSDGVGPGLVINGNLILGNTAESGYGGGVAFQAVNGSDMVAFPTDPGQWNTVTFTNNIVANNVAGWDGGGISLEDAPNVNVINNTIVFNNSTASAGPLFNTSGAQLASTPPPGPPGPGVPCTTNCGVNSQPRVAGLVAIQHSAILQANLASLTLVCPPGHFQTGAGATATNGSCKRVSYPKLENNIVWKNSSYYIHVGSLGAGTLNQQNVVALFSAFTGTQAASQTTTGACVNPTSNTSIWDIGVRGDTGPGNHSSTVTLTASDSILTVAGQVTGSGNSTGDPGLVASYCNGSRVPPEFGSAGWQVPPGIADATVPNPIFNLTPAATVDEGNNWVNLSYGPLSLTNPTVVGGANANYGGGLPLGNYSISSSSTARNMINGGTNGADVPYYDFFGTVRRNDADPSGPFDAGAVEFVPSGPAGGNAMFTPSPALLDFGLVPVHSPTTLDQDVVITNSGGVSLTLNNGSISCAGVTNCSPGSFTIQGALPGGTGSTCGGTILAPGESCIINVVFNPTSTSQAARNANLLVTVGGVSQTVALTGHDTIATITVSPLTPALTTTPANATAKTGTITIRNTANLCLATPCPGGSSVDAGPWIPTAITLTQNSGTGTFALGGTCAVGTPVNPGVAATPGNPATPGGSCTITITYTPPVGATGAALNGSVHLTVTGIGVASTAPVINANYNGN